MIASNNTSVFLQTLLYVMNQSAIQQDDHYNYYYMETDKVMNATKCYGSYGCFPLSPPWTSELRPLAVFPEDINKIEPSFLLFTRKNPKDPMYIDLNDFDFVDSSGIEPHLPLYTIAHGFLESGDRVWIAEMARELLIREDCNVVSIDWYGGAGPPYTQAVANVRLVGAMTAHFLADLARYTGDKQLDHVHMIGHSLGAHLSAYAGYTLQKDFGLKLGRITGMDPAGPHFMHSEPPVRLDRTAAHYVDIIHSHAGALLEGGLGIKERIGHVDYYPNGGTNQPGCTNTMVEHISSEGGSFFRGIRKYLGCSHIRSYEYFLESINTQCNFNSISCKSYEDFKNGTCFKCGQNGHHCLTMGISGRKQYEHLVNAKVIEPHHNLVQYLLTAEQSPFCRSHYRITIDISNSTESKSHGGEVGQFLISMHSSRDGKGLNSGKVTLNEGGYYEPGAQYRAVVAAHQIPYLKTINVEWKFNTNVLNPLTWRLYQTPRIYVSTIQVDSLENSQSITVCPKNNKPLLSGSSQLMMSSYCA